MTEFKTVRVDLEKNDVKIIHKKRLNGGEVIVNGQIVPMVKAVYYDFPFINTREDIKKATLRLVVNEKSELLLND